jgi:molecular chaperone DnaK (HSP70)
MKIGVDLGTTTSTVVRLGPNGKPIAPYYMAPSLGAWRNGRLSFGEEAYLDLQDENAPAFPVRDIKISLGKQSVKVGGLPIEVEDILTEFFRYLANKVAPGQTIEEAAIGTPVNVTEEHRLALISSAEKAGFQKVRLVYEPTSALVGAMNPEQMSRFGIVLVVDWGGGTLDLSLVKKENDCLREIAVDGDISKLGGSQMDARIVEKMLDRANGMRAHITGIVDGLDRLKVEVEREKRSILEALDPADDELEISPFWLGNTLVLKGTDVVDVVSQMAEDASRQIIDFLARAGVSVSNITHVLFAGGVCRCPIVRDQILAVLPDVEVLETTIPQQLTGYGCARLLSYGFELRLAADFGVRQSDNSFCRLLPADHNIGLGTFRIADFMVTDPSAPEAIFDFGIVSGHSESSGMLSESSEGFTSLKVVSVRCQQREGQLCGISSTDLVRVYAGVSHALAATIHAESNAGQASVTDRISGIPFAISLNRPE